MMNYNTQSNEDGTFCIVETQTGSLIESNLTKEEAKSRVRFLNFGGGFDGWSPAFIHERIEIAY